MDQMSEEELRRLLASNLRRYEGLFVEYYYQYVFKCAREITNNDVNKAEDLTQTVFLCVLQALRKKRAEEIERITFKTYLRRATENCLRNMFRICKITAESLDTSDGIRLQALLIDPDVRYGWPENVFEGREFRRHLHELLRNLSPRHRKAVYWRIVRELPYPAIAQKMNVSEADAQSLVYYGKKKIKRLVHEQGFGEEKCFE
jgi:RNA polymerase sigma factor (sigma-70 family)